MKNTLGIGTRLLYLIAVAHLGFYSCAALGKKKHLSAHERAEILVELAYGMLTDGDTIGALQKLKEAENLEDDNADIYHIRALAYYSKKDYESAIQACQTAIRLKPDFSGVKTTLGAILLESGRESEAIQPLTEAGNDSMNREAFKALTSLGIIYYHRMNYSKAQEVLSRAIDADPVSACKAYYYRGHVELKDGKFSEALKDYDHATKMVCGGFAEAYLAKGIAFERSKRYDEARKVFLLIHQRFPKTSVAEEALSHYQGLP